MPRVGTERCKLESWRLKSETERIDAEHAAAVKAAADKFDADLLADAKGLAKEYRDRMWGLIGLGGQPFFNKYAEPFNLSMQMMPLATAGNGWATATAWAFLPPPSPNSPTSLAPPFGALRGSLWVQFFQSEYREQAERSRNEFQVSGEHPDFYQLHVTARDALGNPLPGVSYYDVCGISYEYSPRAAGKTFVELQKSKRWGLSQIWLVYDFDPVHAPAFTGASRLFLYADGHVAPSVD